MKRYELVIVGGGMAGLTLLASLKPAIDQGLKVAVIDPAPAPAGGQIQSPSFDDRATALSAQALQALQALDLTGLESAVSDIRRIEVSDRGHFGFHEMAASQLGFERFGAVIANRTLGNLLWQQVKTIPAGHYFGQQVQTVQPRADGHQLRLSDGTELHTELLVLCDGGRSALTQQLGLHYRERSFHASARIATVETSSPHRGAAFERFTESGPIALLPFGDYSALVWTVPDDQQHDLPDDPDSARTWLDDHFGQRLGRIRRVSAWQEYPLTERTLDHPIGHGFIALGNAAATLHPVAGQGFNLALRGVQRCAESINRHWCETATLPDYQALDTLAGAIQHDQDQTVRFSRQLIQLFGSGNPLIQLGRGLGLNSLDRHPAFSRLFALNSMGLLAAAPLSNEGKSRT